MVENDTSKIPIQLSHNCLIASIQLDLHLELVPQFQKDLLIRIQKTNVQKVIIDLSCVEIIDGHTFQKICATIDMAKLMGAKTILVGLNPGVVSCLVDIIDNFARLHFSSNIENALQLFKKLERS